MIERSAAAGPAARSRPGVQVESLLKRFGPVTALSAVSLQARPGEVLALMGENGAGKSTLLKILSGDIQPDEGRILIEDEPVSFADPAAARRLGIRVISQEPEIVPHISVAENIYIGDLPAKGRVLDRAALARRVRQDLLRSGFGHILSPEALGRDLSAAQRQLVEIMRALHGPVRLVAFDEPTSSLGEHEVEAVFALISRLRARGVAIIYVSHRMNEIYQVADQIAVLRDGRMVGVHDARHITEAELVRQMVGRDVSAMVRRPRDSGGAVMLRLDRVCTDDVRDVSLEVRAGEVVGLAGLVGAGRSELVRAVVGDLPIRSGTVSVDGKTLRLRSPADAIAAGIGFAPEERKADALLLERSVRDNVSLASLSDLSRARVVRRPAERRLVGRFVQQLRVRTPSIEQEVRRLSGGNQQKVVLARWLATNPKVLILDEPTRGVDVGAKAEIYMLIDDLAARGVAVLVISSELPEVLRLCDRIVVMRAGAVTGEVGRAGATEEQLLTLAMPDHTPNRPTAEGAIR